MSHNHNYAYKKTSTCSPLAKEGSDVVCTATVKYYYDAAGLEKLEEQATNEKDAANAYDKVVTIANADAMLAEVAAVK